MNKTELVEDVAKKCGLTKAQTQGAIRALVSTIVGAVADGDKVSLLGFGSFEPRERAAREGRNPKTGEIIKIPAARVPTFSAGKAFREAVNK
jgi:DNA-binding protein HU-beta